MVDNSIALQVNPPPVSDLSTTLLKAYQIRNADTQNQLSSLQLQGAQQRQGALQDYSMRKQAGDPRAVEALNSQPDVQHQVFENLDSAQKQRINRIMDAASSAWTSRNDPKMLKERVAENAGALLKSGDIDQMTHDAWVNNPDPTLALNELLVKGVGISKQFELETKIASQKTFETYDKLLSGVPGAPKYDPFQIRLFGGESNFRNVPTGIKNAEGQPASTAFGPGQMTADLWNGVMKNYPQLGLKPEDRFVAEKQAIAEPYVRYEHINAIGKTGLPPTDKNLAMMWFLGEPDGKSFLSGMAKNPEQPATALVSEAAVKSNRSVFFAPDGQPLPAARVYNKITGSIPNDNVGVQTLAQSMARSGQSTPVAPDSPQDRVVQNLSVYERMMRDPRLSKDQQEAAREAFKIGMEYAKPTGDIKDYEYDKTHRGELLTRQLALRKSGATQVNIDAAGGKKIAEGLGERYLKAEDASVNAAAELRQYEQLDKLLDDPNVYTGTAAGPISEIKKAGVTLLGLDLKGVPNAEVAKKIVDEIALSYKKKSSDASTSDFERKLYERMSPNIGDSAAGRKLLIAMRTADLRNTQQQAEIWRAHLKKDGSVDPTVYQALGELEAGRRKELGGFMETMSTMAGATTQPQPTAGATDAIEQLKKKYQDVKNKYKGMEP